MVNQIEQRFYVIIRYTDGDCGLETEGPMNENEAYARRFQLENGNGQSVLVRVQRGPPQEAQ